MNEDMMISVGAAVIGAAVVGIQIHLNAMYSDNCQEASMTDVPEIMFKAGAIIGALTGLTKVLDDKLQKSNMVNKEYKGCLTKAVSFLVSRGVYAYTLQSSQVGQCIEGSISPGL